MIEKIKKYLFDSYHRPTAKMLHVFVFFKSFFYNKKTILFSEKMLLLKDPPNTMVYFNFFGRIVSILTNLITILFFNKFFDKNTFIDNGIMQNRTISAGDDNIVWPVQSLKNFEKSSTEVKKEFLESIEKNYNYSIELISSKENYEDSTFWKKRREEYKKEFFENNKLKITALDSFRANKNTKSAILSDLSFLEGQGRFEKIKALSLINLYHKISEHVELEILRKASDSYVGNNICLDYRNQRLSHPILRHTYFCSQILKFTNLKQEDHNIIVNVGAGYGGLDRLLKYNLKNSTIIIFEIPEACVFASYFLKKNFPDAKIGQANEFKDLTSIDFDLAKKFDFIILPQPMIEKLSDNLVDLTINTISLGEMTENTQNYYIKNIERITKSYFYSVNRAKRREKFNARGFYSWNFEKKWDAKLYNFSPTYHIEFLGKKSIN